MSASPIAIIGGRSAQKVFTTSLVVVAMISKAIINTPAIMVVIALLESFFVFNITFSFVRFFNKKITVLLNTVKISQVNLIAQHAFGVTVIRIFSAYPDKVLFGLKLFFGNLPFKFANY